EGDALVHESLVLPEFELAPDVGHIETREPIAIPHRPLEQARRQLRLTADQSQIIGVVRARQDVTLVAALLKRQVIFRRTALIGSDKSRDRRSLGVNCPRSRKERGLLPLV